MILLIWVVLVVSTVAVGVHAAVLVFSPEAPTHKDPDRHRTSTSSGMARIPRKWEDQGGDW